MRAAPEELIASRANEVFVKPERCFGRNTVGHLRLFDAPERPGMTTTDKSTPMRKRTNQLAKMTRCTARSHVGHESVRSLAPP